MHAADKHPNELPLQAPWQPADLVRVAWWGLAVALWFVAGLFVVRRVAGALNRPLPGWELLLAAACIVLVAAVSRWLARGLEAGQGSRRPQDRPAAWKQFMPLPACLALLAALTLPGVNWPAAGAAWSLLLISELLALGPGRVTVPWRRSEATGLPITAPPGGSLPVPTTNLPVARPQAGEWDEHNACDEEEAESLHDDPRLMQQWSRRSTDEAGDLLEGWVRANLAPGQRTVFVHVPFCPPFARLPEVLADIVAGPEATVRVGQLLSHGVRLEVRLRQPADAACQVTVGCCATLAAAETPSPG